MSIIRFVEGEYKTEIEKSWTVFTDQFEAMQVSLAILLQMKARS